MGLLFRVISVKSFLEEYSFFQKQIEQNDNSKLFERIGPQSHEPKSLNRDMAVGLPNFVPLDHLFSLLFWPYLSSFAIIK